MCVRLRRPAALRGACLLVLFLLVLAVRVQAGSAASGLITGVTDDGFRWRTQEATTFARLLGLSAFRVSLPWEPRPSRPHRRLTPASSTRWCLPRSDCGRSSRSTERTVSTDRCCGPHGVLHLRHEPPRAVPDHRRCRDLERGEPRLLLAAAVRPDGASAAPAAYGRLLAQCWDILHSLRPSVNLVTSTSPSGNDNPNAVSNVSHAPGSFLRKLGAAYRASGRTQTHLRHRGPQPVRDELRRGSLAKAPDATHISQGDIDRLVQALTDGFLGTAQPTPAACGAAASAARRIWYLEAGYQTPPDAAHRSQYTGRENDAQQLRTWPRVGAPTQAAQLKGGVELAHCQPLRRRILQLPALGRTRSCALAIGCAVGRRIEEASFDALQRAVADSTGGHVDCGTEGSQASPLQPAPDAIVDRIEWSTTAVFSRFNEIWSFALAARVQASYRATVYRHERPRPAGRRLEAGGSLDPRASQGRSTPRAETSARQVSHRSRRAPQAGTTSCGDPVQPRVRHQLDVPGAGSGARHVTVPTRPSSA